MNWLYYSPESESQAKKKAANPTEKRVPEVLQLL